MSLANFHGKWKEIESKNDSEFLKSVGVSKTKRRVAKRMKVKCKWDVQDENCYIYTNKLMGVCDKIVLGEAFETQSRTFGLARQISHLEEATGDLVSTITILKPDGNIDVPEGTVLSNRISVNGKCDRLTIQTTHEGNTLVKIMKKRKMTAEEEAAEEAADLKALAEAEKE